MLTTLLHVSAGGYIQGEAGAYPKIGETVGVDLLPTVKPETSYAPEKWSPRHKIICAMHAAGLRNKEIAAQLDVSESHVSIILRDPRAELELASLMTEVEDQTLKARVKLLSMVAKSLNVIDHNLDSANERVAQTAAIAVLDRTGFGKDASLSDVAAQIDEEVEARIHEAIGELREIRSTYKQISPSIEDAEFSDAVMPEIPDD